MTSWRDILPVHPAAELFPMMPKDELRKLGEDIKANGLKSPVVIWSAEGEIDKGRKRFFLLDGRNRLDAMELVGVQTVANGKLCPVRPENVQRRYSKAASRANSVADPYAYVISVNIQRRHLTTEERRELIANVLKAKPDASDLAIAKQTKTSDKTVAKVRKKMAARSEIPNVETRTDTKGRKQPAKKARPEQEVFDSPQEAHSGTVLPDSPFVVEEPDPVVDILMLIEALDYEQRQRFEAAYRERYGVKLNSEPDDFEPKESCPEPDGLDIPEELRREPANA
jgi:hypothetical protein